MQPPTTVTSTPATPSPQPIKQEETASSNIKKKRTRDTGLNALYTVSASLESVAGAYTDGPKVEASFATPQRMKAAIAAVEEDEGLSDNELMEVAELFRRNTSIADAYMAFSKPAARTTYLQRHLALSDGL